MKYVFTDKYKYLQFFYKNAQGRLLQLTFYILMSIFLNLFAFIAYDISYDRLFIKSGSFMDSRHDNLLRLEILTD